MSLCTIFCSDAHVGDAEGECSSHLRCCLCTFCRDVSMLRIYNFFKYVLALFDVCGFTICFILQGYIGYFSRVIIIQQYRVGREVVYRASFHRKVTQ